MSSNLNTIVTGCAIMGAALAGFYLLDQQPPISTENSDAIAALTEPPPSLSGTKYTLTGSCVRQQFVVPVYVSSLYIEAAQKSSLQQALALIDDPSRAKILVNRWLSPMTVEELFDEFSAYFADSDPDRVFDSSQQSVITQLIYHLSRSPIDEEDILMISWQPENTLYAGYRSRDTFVIDDPTLSTAIWQSLFMPTSPLNAKELIKDITE